MQITADVGKILKIVQPDAMFVFDDLSEFVIIFVSNVISVKAVKNVIAVKNLVSLTKVFAKTRLHNNA